jgi:hypothetical protein
MKSAGKCPIGRQTISFLLHLDYFGLVSVALPRFIPVFAKVQFTARE